MLTLNNPNTTLTTWFDMLKIGAKYARAQTEEGESGTRHFQACVGYTDPVRIKRMHKNFKGAHVEFTKNAMAAWNYCGKVDTRVGDEPVHEHGVPPAAKNVKGDTKARNLLIIQKGVVEAVE